jgi:type VI protein secretion system component Hcp
MAPTSRSVYMRLGGVINPGEPQWFEVHSLHFAPVSPTDSAGFSSESAPSEPNVNEIVVTKATASTSPSFYQHLLMGTNLPLSIVSAPNHPSQETVAERITLTNASVVRTETYGMFGANRPPSTPSSAPSSTPPGKQKQPSKPPVYHTINIPNAQIVGVETYMHGRKRMVIRFTDYHYNGLHNALFPPHLFRCTGLPRTA